MDCDHKLKNASSILVARSDELRWGERQQYASNSTAVPPLRIDQFYSRRSATIGAGSAHAGWVVSNIVRVATTPDEK
jgi:hypothetical protein